MKLLLLIFPLILAISGLSQPIKPSTGRQLEVFMATNGKEMESASTVLTRHLAQLTDKRSRISSEVDFIRYTFTSTHKKFLKHFSPQATFAELFEDGTYSCLTGTILYSLLLSDLNIRHQVIETNYHIFILVATREGELLLEATDRQNGVVTGFNEISERIERYKTTPVVTTHTGGDLSYYQFSFDLYNPVATEELTGLLYYNLAIDAYNKHDLQQAVFYLGEAIARYTSPRIEEMARLLLLTVHESKLSASEKSAFKKTLQTIRYKTLPVVAGLQP
jgi:hypothetical protein